MKCSGTYRHPFVLSSPRVAQTVKNLPAMQETWDPSLGQEDPLEKGMAPHSSILAWRIPWTEEPGGLQSMTESQTRLSDITFLLSLYCQLQEATRGVYTACLHSRIW